MNEIKHTRNSHTAAIDYTTFPHSNHRHAVKTWNERFPVGTLICLWKDNGEALVTRTRTPAQYRNGAVIFLEGVSGSYSLGAVRPVIWHESAFYPIDEHIDQQELIQETKKTMWDEAYEAGNAEVINDLAQDLNLGIAFINGLKRAIKHLQN